MNCDEVQQKIPDYLEDMVPESCHHDVHTHLRSCKGCMRYAEQIGTFASELKRVSPDGLSFDLVAAVSREIFSASEGVHNFRKRIFLLSIVMILLGSSGVLLGITAKDFFAAWEEHGGQENKDAVYFFNELKRIDKELERVVDQEIAPVKEGRQKPIVESLGSLFWHYRFEDERLREAFLKKLSFFENNFIFNSKSCVALQLDQSFFSELSELLKEYKPSLVVQPRRSLVDLPESRKIPQLTFFVQTANDLKVSRYLKVKFLRQNSYVLLERLKSERITPVYQAGAFFLFHFTKQDYLIWQSVFQQMMAVEILEGDLTALFPSNQESLELGLQIQEF